MEFSQQDILLAHVETTNVVRPKDLTSFDKIVVLFGEGPETRGSSSAATRSRRKIARNGFNTVMKTQGFEVFLICAFTWPITAMASASAKDMPGLLRSLQEWWANAKVPTAFHAVAKTYFEKYRDVFPDAELRRTYAMPTTYHNSFNAIGQDAGSRAIGMIGGISEALEDDCSDDSEQGEQEEQVQLAQPVQPAQQDEQVLFAGEVYKLQAMDAIRVLSTNAGDVRLTIPRYQGVQPFITIQCPEKTAILFLRKRQKIM